MNAAARKRVLVFAFTAPAAAILLAVVLYPFVYNMLLSFSDMSLRHFRLWSLIGLKQYSKVFSEPGFYTVFGKTILWTVINVFFHVLIGVFLALVLNQQIKGRSIFRTLLILPWAIPQFIVALTWRGMFNYEYGAINLILSQYLGLSPIPWLQSPTGAFAAAIITNIWLGFPFMMAIALGGLQSIPGELYEAADIDGATSWQKTRSITLPLLKPVMIPAITLGIVWTFNNLNIVWLISNGGEPADQTHILVSYVYRAAFNLYRFGYAAALSVVIFVILLVLSLSFMKRTHATASAY